MTYKYKISLCGWGDAEIGSSEVELRKNDKVIVSDEAGNIMGKIQSEVDINKRTCSNRIFSVLRIATKNDLNTFKKNSKKQKEILNFCRMESRKMRLGMKFIDAYITIGKGIIIVSFIADGRIDFRQLVKNISREFHRSVRIRQIGSRDEARNLGGCGICGKELCCSKFLGEIPSISTDMAKIQQVAQRGSSRISGACGRLMCCLSYESEQYRQMLRGMPEFGSWIKSKQGRGQVVDINAIKQEVRIKLEDGNFVTIKKEEL